jgi:uncharacterized protein YifN (PemK superfamily)
MALPAPEPGLVIDYAYLWHRAHRQGEREGRKHRPSVIVLAAKRAADGATVVTVLPITHSPPTDLRFAVEISQRVKRHLGLDDARSWIIVTEGNRFVWPSYDLRRRTASGRFDHGFLPPKLFAQVQQAFVACYRAGQGRIVLRD